jgi:hypothetical protein
MDQDFIMSNPDHLSRVVAAFEQWRQTKNKQHTTIPSRLRQQAVALLDEYSSSKITSALRLSGAQLKNWAGVQHIDEQPPVFVHLPLACALPHQALSIALHFRQGGQLTLSGEISPALLSAMIREMNT